MSEFADKVRSIGYLSRGRTRDRVISEGRAHPESGKPFKTVRDEAGNDVTEHGPAGAGVSDRQDVHLYQREPVRLTAEVNRDGTLKGISDE